MKSSPRYLSDIQRGIFPELTSATVIGISVAIAGNILISLALNLQKLAHKRLDAEKIARNGTDNNGKSRQSNGNTRLSSTMEEDNEDEDDPDPEFSINQHKPQTIVGSSSSETQPLLLFPQSTSSNEYGTSAQNFPPTPRAGLSRPLPSRRGSSRVTAIPAMPVDIIDGDTIRGRIPNSHKPSHNVDTKDLGDGYESEYLKSKLWWFGFLLMNVGELGNFISYAWAPASTVAPLGTFALVANCFFSPFLLGERFRKRDLFGVIIAIIGAVTVVLSSNASDGRLNPDGLIRAISQTPFIVYSCVYIVGIMILAYLSPGPIGRDWVFVDVGLCALFGGFTVLSTKAVSTLLTMRWDEVFTSYITYPVILVLILTGVGQIRYLNRALMRFDSKTVIPIQFVLFNLSAIVGSAILYGDFKKATFHQMVTFLYGCGATFAGVFIIAWSSENRDSDIESEESEEDLTPTAADESTDVESNSIPSGFGSLGRRRRATLVLPPGLKSNEVLRHKHSAVSIMALSPAQPLLLVHTPPRELREFAVRDDTDSPTPGSYRRRALSWFGDEAFRERSFDQGRGTRDSSLVGRSRVAPSPGTSVSSINLPRGTAGN
ncbi:DUF803-domain-containing protein [Dendrothele bispora CBS 962.96]|uniref:DUF803-domain-containing protein n=1 Tax=Dendrothele bispora (strain CBS 962.96) TaxID=1314807 RepID=A0A4V4HJ20_DENBC|nr:DUF803-domain-containing protein [Dendrothele bispora CBS 962.96]